MAGGLVITFSCPITFISLRVVQLSRSQWRSGCRCGRASALASSRPRWILRHLSGNRITLIAIFDHEKLQAEMELCGAKCAASGIDQTRRAMAIPRFDL